MDCGGACVAVVPTRRPDENRDRDFPDENARNTTSEAGKPGTAVQRVRGCNVKVKSSQLKTAVIYHGNGIYTAKYGLGGTGSVPRRGVTLQLGDVQPHASAAELSGPR